MPLKEQKTSRAQAHSGIVSDPHKLLAEITPFEQLQKGGGRIGKTLSDTFLDLDLASVHQRAHVTQELTHQVEMVEDNKTLNPQPTRQNVAPDSR